MIRDITLGQYYPADSVLHRMDPRAKLVGTMVFIISVFVFHTFPGYAVATLFLAGMIIISKVPPKFMFKGLKAIVMLLLITVVFNILLTPGKVLWQWGILHVTEEGLKLAGRMAIRLTYLVIGSSIMTLTTTPNQLTDGLERLLRPLNKLHVPIHEIAMNVSIALRFIPNPAGRNRQDHESTNRPRCRLRKRKSDPESQKYDPASGSAVYLRIPQSQRSGNGNGSKMLPRRR